jgi:hypothetical protein
VNILLRSFIVWCLLLALPLQGFAAATMPACAPVPAAPAMAMAMAPHHDHQAMLAMQRAAPAATDDSACAAHAAGKCHACAACCPGAMPCASLRLAPGSAPNAAITLYSGFLPVVDLALPERPPQAAR